LVAPNALTCNSISGALTPGFDTELCRNSCGPSSASAYANSPSARPLAENGVRPSMLLAARDVDTAQRLIDRGVAADGSPVLRGGPPASVYLLSTAGTLASIHHPGCCARRGWRCLSSR
jgi:hypothetical protein